VPLAQGAGASNPTLDVIFSVSGTVTVTLPDGSAVGTTSGSPTVIPAGYYAIDMSGPGGCIVEPLFDLQGPGENLVDDMSGGEVVSESYNAYLRPDSTYTWRIDNVSPPTVYSFVTSGVVLGSPPEAPSFSTAPAGASTTAAPTSADIVGSAIVPERGTLTGVLSAAGRLRLSYHGRNVSGLSAGRYRIAVHDQSPTLGLLLESPSHRQIVLSGRSFVGTRASSVDLSAGSWVFTAGAAGAAQAVQVAAQPAT